MVGYNSGGTCEDGSNNTFLGTYTQLHPGEQSLSGSIALGAGVVISNYNQLMVASNVTSFNISGLTSSTGSREGTILEFDSEGNISPSAGTYNSVSKIDTAVSRLQDQPVIQYAYDTSYTVTVTGGFTVESSSTNAYWYTNSEGVIYFNIHMHNKIDSSARSYNLWYLDLWSTSRD